MFAIVAAVFELEDDVEIRNHLHVRLAAFAGKARDPPRRALGVEARDFFEHLPELVARRKAPLCVEIQADSASLSVSSEWPHHSSPLPST